MTEAIKTDYAKPTKTKQKRSYEGLILFVISISFMIYCGLNPITLNS